MSALVVSLANLFNFYSLTMLLSSRIRKAVCAMVVLAQHEQEKPVPLREISTILDISLSNLEQVFSLFRKHGLVESTRGPGGGYTLARSPREIKISEILQALDEDIHTSSTNNRHQMLAFTEAAEMWATLERQGIQLLDSISLLSLIPPGTVIKSSEKKSLKLPIGIYKRRLKPAFSKKAVNSVFSLARSDFLPSMSSN